MEEIKGLISDTVQRLFGVETDHDVTITQERFGDFASNVALKLSKQLNKPPRDIATELSGELIKTGDFAAVDIAGPGFINISLTNESLINLVESPRPEPLTGKTVVAEYSDPNPFKVLHAGHLYTTLVGDVVARLQERAGATVHRVNFGGDVGLHVAKAMWGIIQSLDGEYPDKLTEIEPRNRPAWISARYVEGNNAYENDEQSKAEIVKINKKIYDIHNDDDHETPFARIYWTCRQWSYDGFDELYKKLQVNTFEKYYPESQTTPKGVELAKQALDKGILTRSDGAVVFKGEDKGLHTRVFINSAGLPTYESKDLGLAAIKWLDYKPDINIIITANDIEQYMQVVLKVVEGFYPEIAGRTIHLTHGMLKLTGGVKMSSRKGNILQANDILDATEAAAKQAKFDSSFDTVLAAIKYAFLKHRIGGDIIYDPSESVTLEGNSGPYVQYAHARGSSILQKLNKPPARPDDLEKEERSLIRKISEYKVVFQQATEELRPHYICTYLYELAQTFNRFYEANRIIGHEREAERAYIVQLYVQTLANGLELLGITAPESM